MKASPIFFALLFTFSIHSFASNVLVIGDSLSVPKSYGFGNELSAQLSKQGHQVATLASCGSAPQQFVNENYSTKCGYYRKHANGKEEYVTWNDFNKGHSPILTPKLKEVVDFQNGKKPDWVVIQQGTNLYGQIVSRMPLNTDDKKNAAKRGIQDRVRILLNDLKKNSPNSRCLWVAPPEIAQYYKEGGGMQILTRTEKDFMFQSIQEEIKKDKLGACEIYDSRKDTNPPSRSFGRDGVHFQSTKEVNSWVSNVKDHLSRLMNNAPTSGTENAH